MFIFRSSDLNKFNINQAILLIDLFSYFYDYYTPNLIKDRGI